MRFLCLFFALAGIAPAFAQGPILRHVVNPRRVIVLDGPWRSADGGTVTFPHCIGSIETNRVWSFTREVEFPAEVDGMRAFLRFERAGDRIEVEANGIGCGAAEPYGLPLSCEITKGARPGRNEIKVSFSSGERRWGEHLTGISEKNMGSTGPMYLEFVPQVSVSDVFVKTFVVGGKKAEIEIGLENAGAEKVSVEIGGKISDGISLDGVEVGGSRAEIAAGGCQKVVLRHEWSDAPLWTPDDPRLLFFDAQLKLVGSSTVCDAYRVRFGWREIGFSGERLTLNGHPFMMLRGWLDGATEVEDIRKTIARVKEHAGLVGTRVFLPGTDLLRLAEAADEEGFLISTCSSAGGGAAGKLPVFWGKLRAQMEGTVRNFRNHPSVLCWGIANEFGQPYGGSPQSRKKEQDLGAFVASLDPTRPWTAYGEVEVGSDKHGDGPASVRSLHYPVPPCAGWNPMPDTARWQATGGGGWQGRWKRNKPLVVSEDLYHGLLDVCRGMTKWGGDDIYTREGYYHAWWEALRLFYEGYCLGGLSGWEPWVTFPAQRDNPLFTLWGNPTPRYLVAQRDFGRNLVAGEPFGKTVDIHNCTFTPLSGKVCFAFAGEKWESKVDIPPGESIALKVARVAPQTGMIKEVDLSVTLENSAGERLAQEKFEWFSCPRVDVDRAIAEATADGSRRVVLGRRMSAEEGRGLAEFAAKGGRVLLADLDPAGWTPFEVEKTSIRRTFRRNGDVLAGVPEKALWFVVNTAYAKPSGADVSIWLDAGAGKGMRYVVAMRVPVGKGDFICTQLPLSAKESADPATGAILKAFLGELARPTPSLDSRLFLDSADGPWTRLMRDFGIATGVGAPTARDVILVDGTKGLDSRKIAAVERHAKSGGVAIVASLPDGKTVPKTWPVRIVSREERKGDFEFDRVGRGTGVVVNKSDLGPYAPWVGKITNEGLVAGMQNEDLCWHSTPDDFWSWYRGIDIGQFPYRTNAYALTAEIEPRNGARLLTKPGGLAEFSLGKGQVVICTLDLPGRSASAGEKCEAIVRTLLGNLGVRTGESSDFHPRRWHPIALTEANSGFYNWPQGKWNRWLKDHPQNGGKSNRAQGWFGGDDDMRYFPVNQCGWSPVSRNNCPVEPFPSGLVSLAGVKFKFPDPEGARVGNRVCVAMAPRAKVVCPVKSVAAHTLWLVGAAEKGSLALSAKDEGDDVSDMLGDVDDGLDGGGLDVLVRFGEKSAKPVKTSFRLGRDFGGYSELETLKEGKIAWCGNSFKHARAALYLFKVSIPHGRDGAASTLASIEISNKMANNSFMLVGITAEE